MHHTEAVRSTLDAMRDQNVGAIFEAAYMKEGVRIRADILERLPSGCWNLIEVKSSTGVKEEYLTDIAVQYRVLQMAGLDLDRVYLMHINREYVFSGGEIDLSRFMVLEDLTDDAIRLQDFVLENLNNLKNVLSTDFSPNVQPSRHCHRPHTCEFWEHCTRNTPEHWIFELSGIRQERFEDLHARGVAAIDEIPESFPLTAIQQRIRDCVIESREYVDPQLKNRLSDIEFPVHFLDFETAMPAIPRYSGTKPYQTLPFQWSNHILYPDGKIEHRDFLFDNDRDPRPEFTRTLLDVLGDEGTIFIYTTYEQRILRELAELLPQYADTLEGLHRRFVDLCAVIKNHYYNPRFHGSFSLKSILPALVPEMDYQNLAIQEGGMASLEYLRMIDPKTPAAEKKEIRNNLLVYCGQDTLAMVRIREVLLGKLKRAL
jgi:predicted RecB family nuclease